MSADYRVRIHEAQLEQVLGRPLALSSLVYFQVALVIDDEVRDDTFDTIPDRHSPADVGRIDRVIGKFVGDNYVFVVHGADS